MIISFILFNSVLPERGTRARPIWAHLFWMKPAVPRASKVIMRSKKENWAEGSMRKKPVRSPSEAAREMRATTGKSVFSSREKRRDIMTSTIWNISRYFHALLCCIIIHCIPRNVTILCHKGAVHKTREEDPMPGYAHISQVETLFAQEAGAPLPLAGELERIF